MNRPTMSYLLPAAASHLHCRPGEVPARVEGQRLWRHRRGAVLADLLTSSALSLRGDALTPAAAVWASAERRMAVRRRKSHRLICDQSRPVERVEPGGPSGPAGS